MAPIRYADPDDEGRPTPDDYPQWVREIAADVDAVATRYSALERFRREVRSWATSRGEVVREPLLLPDGAGCLLARKVITMPVDLLPIPDRPLTLPEKFALLAAIHDVGWKGEKLSPWAEDRWESDYHRFKATKEAIPFSVLKSNVGETPESDAVYIRKMAHEVEDALRADTPSGDGENTIHQMPASDEGKRWATERDGTEGGHAAALDAGARRITDSKELSDSILEPRDSKLRPCDELAYNQHKFAIEQEAALKTLRDVYNWLRESRAIDDSELPAFATWCAYVRKARRAKGESSRSRGNPTRSVITPAKIEARPDADVPRTRKPRRSVLIGKLEPLPGEITVAIGEPQRRKLWESAADLLRDLGVPEEEIDRLLSERDPAALMGVVNRLCEPKSNHHLPD